VFALDAACCMQLTAYSLQQLATCSWRYSRVNLTFDCILIKKWSNIQIKAQVKFIALRENSAKCVVQSNAKNWL